MYHQKAADFYPSGACAKVENELLFLLPPPPFCLPSSLCALLWGCLSDRYTANGHQSVLKGKNT